MNKRILNEGYQPSNHKNYGYQPSSVQRGHQPSPQSTTGGNNPPRGTYNPTPPSKTSSNNQ